MLSQAGKLWQFGAMTIKPLSALTFAALACAAVAQTPAPSPAPLPAPAPAAAPDPAKLAPSEIVAAAPASAWVTIAPEDMLVMTLLPDARGRERRVIIQLMPPPFSQGWIGNIRKLAAAHWWDGLSINRVQDNYVVQWGDASEKKALPEGLVTVGEEAYVTPSVPLKIDKSTERFFKKRNAKKSRQGTPETWRSTLDAYASETQFRDGWPFASDPVSIWPVHCYGMIGVGRNLSPDTGSGAELYTVIGHAPRHLDRNIALVGRVISGIEHLSSLPRGTGPLGFYETEQAQAAKAEVVVDKNNPYGEAAGFEDLFVDERTTISSIRLATELPVKDQPRFEYLSTESASFGRYADARANRRDAFFNVPAGGADICNIPVPIRKKP